MSLPPGDRERGPEGTLAFFGRVTASVTHEIKNGLAVINEQSRLIDELLDFSAEEDGPDLSRLKTLIGRIIARIEQTDEVVKRLNKFVHTTDLDREGGDAAEILALVGSLFKRKADIKGLSLEMPADPPALPFRVSPVMVERAVWECLESMAAAAVKGGSIKVGIEDAGDRVRFTFRGQPGLRPERPRAFDPLSRVEVREGEGLDLEVMKKEPA